VNNVKGFFDEIYSRSLEIGGTRVEIYFTNTNFIAGKVVDVADDFVVIKDDLSKQHICPFTGICDITVIEYGRYISLF
jgi:hypothetical protein